MRFFDVKASSNEVTSKHLELGSFEQLARDALHCLDLRAKYRKNILP